MIAGIRNKFSVPRFSAGLTTGDIRGHWNRPLIFIFCEEKIRELVNFVVVDIAAQQGKDISAASTHYKKTFARYGDPQRWDPGEKFNLGLRECDADLYPEFAGRVDSWRLRTTEVEVDRLIQQHGTLNAAVRAMVTAGASCDRLNTFAQRRGE